MPVLFLTSKVRLHCDDVWLAGMTRLGYLFLTSKVRLHCDIGGRFEWRRDSQLFLTSKVRLHCDDPVANIPLAVLVGFS